MKTIVFAIQKGGQGKSMLATHFAFYVAQAKHRVLAVDLDGQGNFSRNLCVEPINKDLAPTLSLFEGAKRPALPLDSQHLSPGSGALYSGDHRLVRVDEVPELVPGSLRESLVGVAAQFDICVIDPPPTLGKRLRAALMAADFVVMPFAPARESVDGLGDLLDTIEQIKKEHNPGLQVLGLLANKINSRSSDEKKTLKEIEAVAPGMLLPTRIHERTSIASAMAASQPVWVRSGGASQRLASQELRGACAHILKVMLKK
jgi:chromosome partitioning protein